MRGVPLRDDRCKYLYRPGWHAGAPGYVSHNFYIEGRHGAQGEVWRTSRNDKTWHARMFAYPGSDDTSTGRTRDKAVDKLLNLLGEG